MSTIESTTGTTPLRFYPGPQPGTIYVRTEGDDEPVFYNLADLAAVVEDAKRLEGEVAARVEHHAWCEPANCWPDGVGARLAGIGHGGVRSVFRPTMAANGNVPREARESEEVETYLTQYQNLEGREGDRTAGVFVDVHIADTMTLDGFCALADHLAATAAEYRHAVAEDVRR